MELVRKLFISILQISAKQSYEYICMEHGNI